MEKGGWLDQILLGVLGFLAQPWLSIVVALVGGAVVAYLARSSPKTDWEFIKEWPGGVLFGAFVLLAGVKVSAPRLIPAEYHIECDSPDIFCGFVVDRQMRYVYDYTVLDYVRDFAISLVQDLIFGGLGFLVGMVIARVVLGRRRNPV